MISHIDILPIIHDHFYPFRFRKGRRFSAVRTTLTVVLPAAVSIALSFRDPRIDEKYQANLLTVFGIIAAVMTALLPITQSVVGVSLQDERYTLAQQHLWNQQKIRLEVLRGLYTSICMSVIYLVISLLPIFCLQIDWMPAIGQQIAAAMIYFVGLAVALCFLEVISGIYLVLDAHATDVDRRLEQLRPLTDARNEIYAEDATK